MLKVAQIVLLAMLTCANISPCHAQQKVANGNQPAQGSKDDKRGTPSLPIEVNAHTIQGKQEATEEAVRDAEQQRVNGKVIGLTWAIAVCALLQFCGTVAQVIVYLKQTSIMRHTLGAISRQADTLDTQVADAKTSNTAAAQTTKDTLEAIQRQAKEMSRQNKNLISSERARIAVRILPIDTLDFDDGTFIHLQIENIGPTHALNVRTVGEVRPSIEGIDPPESVPDELFYATADIYGTGDSSIPGVQSILRANSPPSDGRLVLLFPEEWGDGIEVNDPAITIEAWGWIQYDDVFGQAHSTKFRYLTKLIKTRNLPIDKPFKPHPFTRWRMSQDSQDNHAD